MNLKLFTAAAMILVALSGTASALSEGDPAPMISFKDINGDEGTSDDFKHWVIVYSFADRRSNEPLQEWMGEAGIAVAKAHPLLRIAFINFADVTSVPSLLRGVVRPILRGINNRTMTRMAKAYEKEGVRMDDLPSYFTLVPDWSGDCLKLFGLKNAEEYRCWVASKGKVVRVFDQRTNDNRRKFIELFDELSKDPPDASAVEPTAERGKERP